MGNNLHESFRREEPQKISSERSFGLVFAAVFALVGLWPLTGGGGLRLWALGVAVVFLAAAFLAPGLLAPLNKLWARFGALLHRIVSPVVLGIIYVIAVVPVGLIMRAFGYDPMHRRFDPEAESYWMERDGDAHEQSSMERQF